jgi:hypothetical protein
MPRTIDALAHLSESEREQFKQAAQESLRRPGKFVKLDRAVWQRLEGAMSEAYRGRLARLMDEEQSIEDDVLRMRIR